MVDGAVSMVELNLNYVDASGYGDGFQVIFQEKPPGQFIDVECGLENTGRYFLIQRHFEPPDDGRVYVESEDPEIYDHYTVGTAFLSPDCFDVELLKGKKLAHRVQIKFRVDEETFQEMKRVVRRRLPNGITDG